MCIRDRFWIEEERKKEQEESEKALLDELTNVEKETTNVNEEQTEPHNEITKGLGTAVVFSPSVQELETPPAPTVHTKKRKKWGLPSLRPSRPRHGSDQENMQTHENDESVVPGRRTKTVGPAGYKKLNIKSIFLKKRPIGGESTAQKL